MIASSARATSSCNWSRRTGGSWNCPISCLVMVLLSVQACHSLHQCRTGGRGVTGRRETTGSLLWVSPLDSTIHPGHNGQVGNVPLSASGTPRQWCFLSLSHVAKRGNVSRQRDKDAAYLDQGCHTHWPHCIRAKRKSSTTLRVSACVLVDARAGADALSPPLWRIIYAQPFSAFSFQHSPQQRKR